MGSELFSSHKAGKSSLISCSPAKMTQWLRSEGSTSGAQRHFMNKASPKKPEGKELLQSALAALMVNDDVTEGTTASMFTVRFFDQRTMCQSLVWHI